MTTDEIAAFAAKLRASGVPDGDIGPIIQAAIAKEEREEESRRQTQRAAAAAYGSILGAVLKVGLEQEYKRRQPSLMKSITKFLDL